MNSNWRLYEIGYIIFAIVLHMLFVGAGKILHSNGNAYSWLPITLGILALIWLIFKSSQWTMIFFERFTGFKLFTNVMFLFPLGAVTAMIVLPLGVIYSTLKYFQEKRIHHGV